MIFPMHVWVNTGFTPTVQNHDCEVNSKLPLGMSMFILYVSVINRRPLQGESHPSLEISNLPPWWPCSDKRVSTVDG